MTTEFIERDQIDVYGLPTTYASHILAVLKTVGTTKAAVFNKAEAHPLKVQGAIYRPLKQRGVQLHIRTNGTKWFAWGEAIKK